MKTTDEALPAGAPGEKPTRVRYQVLAGMCSLALITYIDRVCISRMKGDITGDLGLDQEQIGLIFAAFTLGYSLFEVPMGWWGDVVGPRRVITRIVLCWSVFTALTGLAGNISLPLGVVISSYWFLLIVRFLFGVGEAGAFPNITRGLSVWFPFRERGMCQGWVWAAGRFGGAIAPLLFGLLSAAFTAVMPADSAWAGSNHWRVAFVVFSLLGVGWSLWFYPWYRDRPSDKPSVNAAELRLIETDRPPGGDAGHSLHGVPWVKLLLSGNLWALCGMYFAGAYAWYVYITFLPDYLNQVHHLKSGYTEVWNLPLLGAREIPAFDLMCGIPLGFGAVGCLLGGPLTDRLVKTWGWRWGRCLVGFVAMVVCAGLLVLATHMPGHWSAMLIIGLSTLIKDLYMAPSWAVCADIGGKYAGTVAGCMNMLGNLGGVVAPWLIGFLLKRYGSGVETWDYLFYMFAIVNVVGGFLWLCIDPAKPVVGERASEPVPAAVPA